MKSSQSKTSPSSTSASTSDVSSTAKRDQDQNEASRNTQASGTVSASGNVAGLSSGSNLYGHEEFSNLQGQQQQGNYNPSASEGSFNYNASVNAPAQADQSSQQQHYGAQGSYSAQDSTRGRNRSSQYSSQQEGQQGITTRPSELIAQTGMDVLVEAWTTLVLGQVQIATQAAIRLAQCWFAPSLISGISDVQRRYAEDSIASASAAASRLAQFTPPAFNQNQPQYSQHFSAEYGQAGQQRQQQSGQSFGVQAHAGQQQQNPSSSSQDYQQRQFG